MNTAPGRVALIILDGWGIGAKDANDAVHAANTPFFDTLMHSVPHATLRTDGMHVGLPNDQMGNSEVGHMNIGAGRVVYQDLARIDRAIEQGTLGAEPVLQATWAAARVPGCTRNRPTSTPCAPWRRRRG
jgi:2,3-bisphosphoglycerate-independent phosphoglycerate mutase